MIHINNNFDSQKEMHLNIVFVSYRKTLCEWLL